MTLQPNSKSNISVGTAGLTMQVSSASVLAKQGEFDRIVTALDNVLGLALASNYEYPSRYSIWNLGFTNPILVFQSKDSEFTLRCFSRRGMGVLRYLADVLKNVPHVEVFDDSEFVVHGTITDTDKSQIFAEENRTRRLSIFTVVRHLWASVQHPELKDFGFYGAFGYDLIFSFEDISRNLKRGSDQRDIVLFLPDKIHKSVKNVVPRRFCDILQL